MSYTAITLTSAGATIDNYVGSNNYVNILILGTATLAANVVINPSTAARGASFNVRWNGVITLSTFAVTICGQTIKQDQLNQKGNFSCYYDGSNWTVFYYADGSDMPQMAQGSSTIAVPTGGTTTLVAGVDKFYQRAVGSPTTLSSNYTITASTSGIKAGSQFFVEIGGSVTLDGNTMTVFGVDINSAQASSGGVIIIATFDGSAWRGVSTSKPITGADLSPQAALTALVNATNASASPTALNFAVDGAVLQRSGSSLVASLLTAANFDSTSLLGVQIQSTNLSSAQILSSYSSPPKILDAPAAGKINYPIAVIADLTHNGTDYTTNLDADIFLFGATAPIYEIVDLWGYTSSAVTVFIPNILASYSPTLAKGTGATMQLRTKVGNPAVGDGTVTIHVLYVTI